VVVEDLLERPRNGPPVDRWRGTEPDLDQGKAGDGGEVVGAADADPDAGRARTGRAGCDA
jgi:hypothetical protein